MAFSAASFGVMPSSMCRSTPSTTTMASSTTSPMASTSPNKESVLMEKPNNGKNTNVPTSETGTASRGIKRRAPTLQEKIDHQDHERERNEERYEDLFHALRDRARRVQRNT